MSSRAIALPGAFGFCGGFDLVAVNGERQRQSKSATVSGMKTCATARRPSLGHQAT
jgi:hypothetical protein